MKNRPQKLQEKSNKIQWNYLDLPNMIHAQVNSYCQNAENVSLVRPDFRAAT